MALVAWSTMCRPVNQARLGICHLQHTNMALLDKWVRRMMQLSGNLATVVLRDGYGSSLDWEMWRTPRRGDTAFLLSVRTCFLQVQRFFQPLLGDRVTLRFWDDNWTDAADWIGSFLVFTHYPRIRGLWCGRLGMTLPQALPDQRVAELLSLQELLANQRLSEAAQDTWVRSGPSFTTRAAYRLLRDQENSKDLLILQKCRLVWKRRLPLKI